MLADWLVGFIWDIVRFLKPGEIILDERMNDLLATLIGRDICFGDIRGMRAAMDQNLVPRLVSFWLSGVPFVPIVACLACLIAADDHTAILVEPVADHISGSESGLA